MVRPLLEGQLPEGIKPIWFMTPDEAKSEIADADIAWADMNDPSAMRDVFLAGEKLKWVSTIYAGLDHFPVKELAQRGTILTNGVGINTIAVAEYAVMGMLSLAKAYPDVVHAADKREWLNASPGTIELYDSKALIIGYGAIGQAIGERLKGFGVHITGAARTARPDVNILGSQDWQGRIGEFDWVILATPSTAQTRQLLSAELLSAMKKESFVINIARGDCLDQDALIALLQSNHLGGAFLDVTSPEPLPADHILWSMPNVQLSMHLSGRAQRKMFPRSAALFLKNVHAFVAGEPLTNTVDLSLGY